MKATFEIKGIRFEIEKETEVDLIDAIEKIQERIENSGDGEFEADSLVASVLDGKTYWSVKGGRFQKFGLRIWEEVLRATFGDTEYENLNPTKRYNLKGKYRVFHDGKKVTELKKI